MIDMIFNMVCYNLKDSNRVFECSKRHELRNVMDKAQCLRSKRDTMEFRNTKVLKYPRVKSPKENTHHVIWSLHVFMIFLGIDFLQIAPKFPFNNRKLYFTVKYF